MQQGGIWKSREPIGEAMEKMANEDEETVRSLSTDNYTSTNKSFK